MKRFYFILTLCLFSAAGFSQSDIIHKKAKDPQTAEKAAKADNLLINKKDPVNKEKKKKPRREKQHKECSRMKS